MTTGDFAQIAQSCRFLTGFSFPLRTPWAEPGWLSVLAATKIRKIRPWSYIGGYDEYKIEGQCFELMFKVLEQMPDLSDIELHLVALSPYLSATGLEHACIVLREFALSTHIIMTPGARWMEGNEPRPRRKRRMLRTRVGRPSPGRGGVLLTAM